MAHRVVDEEIVVKKKREFSLRRIFKINAPNLMGKFGFSFSIGKKEFFVGVAVANIEVEKVVKRKKQKVFLQEGSGRVFNL